MMKIEKLNFSVRTYNILKRAGFNTVEQLQQLTDDELVCIRNLGRNSLGEIHEKLEQLTMTNADYIRNMSDEELAEFLDEIHNFSGCISLARDCRPTCLECVGAWLAEPFEEKEE